MLSLPYALRFLCAREPAVMGQVLAIAYRVIATHLIGKAGQTHKTAETGAVTLIQRFGSSVNLNIHFHMLALDGVYPTTGDRVRFPRVPAPTPVELQGLVEQIGARVGRALQRQGLLVADDDRSYLTVEPGEDEAMETLQGHSVTYRIALGPNTGRKVFTLQTVPVTHAEEDAGAAAKAAGFSLHAAQYEQ